MELRRYDPTIPGHAVLMLGATARLRGSAVVGACRPHWVLVAGIRSSGSLLFALLRSEEHTSELQSPVHLVCRLLLEKKHTTPNYPSTLFSTSLQTPGSG